MSRWTRSLELREVQGWAEAASSARRCRDLSGLDMVPRGRALVIHVATGMRDGHKARDIAAAVGYSIDRCARRLASAGYAPLGRALLDRAASDEAHWRRGWLTPVAVCDAGHPVVEVCGRRVCRTCQVRAAA